MIEHVVRRGLQHASGMDMFKPAADEGHRVEMPKWAVPFLLTTVFAIIFFMSAVEYTLKDLIATLAMVETPAAAITVSTPEETASKDEKEGLLETTPTITLVHAKPITSSIRATIRHLVSEGGRLARWRGLSIYALWSFTFSLLVNVLAGALPMVFPFRMVVVSGIAGAVCANMHAAWTHKVVSTPSSLTFWQRVPARSSWKILALPAAVSAAMPYFTIYAMHGFITLFGLERHMNDNLSNYSGAQWASLIVRVIALVVIGISCSLFLCLPAIVTLVRVEASILPEDQDTIIPFDRTFDGKVVPKVLGGTGSIGFIDAWRSFNWEARRRLIKLYVKIFFIVVALLFVFAHVIAFALFIAMGPAFGKFITRSQRYGLVIDNNGGIIVD